MRRFWLAACALLAVVQPFSVAAQEERAAQDLAENSQRLDIQTERLLNEMLSLGGEMAVLNEKRTLSDNAQLLVLVSVEPSEFFVLSAVQLEMDGKTLAYHPYSTEEFQAMQKGGAFRLFWNDVRPGKHELITTVFGRLPRDPDFQRQAALTFISGTGHRVMEIHVAQGKSQAFPELSFKEWK